MPALAASSHDYLGSVRDKFRRVVDVDAVRGHDCEHDTKCDQTPMKCP